MTIPQKLGSAQSAGYIISNPPIQSDFPELVVEFKVFDASGHTVQQLNREQLAILEDENPIAVEEVKRVQGSVHFILAINADPILAVRDANGISNYSHLISAIDNWQHPANMQEDDTWSFLVNQGRNVTQLNNLDAWHALVKNYQPDFRITEKGLNSLRASIELAKTNPDRIHQDQVVLYITPAPAAKDLDALATLTQEALDAGVHVNIWMVGNENDANSPRGLALQDLSRASSGSFTLFPVNSNVPDPQTYVKPYGVYYKASYRSQITASGSHTSAVIWQTQAQAITSEINTFQLVVLAPNPVFLSPPINIERRVQTHPDVSIAPQTDLQTIKVLIDFPDGHPRGISYLRLYQDGNMVSEVTSPPFGSISWDIGEVSVSRMVYLQLSLEDELGLQSNSVVLPVNVSVQVDAPVKESVQLTPGQVVMIVVACSGLALIGIVLWIKRRKSIAQKAMDKLKVVTMPGSIPNSKDDNACLISLDKEFMPIDAPAIKLNESMITIGSDPSRADICINHPTLNALHARIQYEAGQGYRVADLGSIAGTWLNFSQVSRQGAQLQNLDLIHFGKVAFRFSIGYTSKYD